MFSRPILAIGALLALLFVTNVHAATTGCGKTPTLTSGTKTITINNKQRQWILRIPAQYNNTQPHKLIFGLHWLGSDMTGVDGGSAPYYGLKALAGNSAIFVAPNGLNQGWGNQGGEDILLLDAVRQAVEADLCVDENLRFSLGFSYGGAMSYSFACSKGKDLRAIAVLSGAPLSGCTGGTDPVAYYGQHGVRDSVLNIAMGRQIRDTFVKANGCQSQSPKEPGANSRQRVATEYTGCSEGHPLMWTAFDGDHVALPGDQGTDAGANSFTIQAVWKFFSQFT